MLLPKKTKYRKQQRGRMAGLATRGCSLAFGEYGLQSLECHWLTAQQIESARRAMTRCIKRGGKVWIKVFPDKPVSARPAETRMGKGKGEVDHWVAVIRPGTILFEMTDVAEDVAREAMRLATHKLPVKTRFVQKQK